MYANEINYREIGNAYHLENQKVRKSIEEFRRELDQEWIKDRRLEFLAGRVEVLKGEVEGCENHYSESFKADVPYWLRKLTLELSEYREGKKELRKLLHEQKSLHCPDNGRNEVTESDIARAREYPFENLIEAKRHFALCPFHNDRKPSFYIKNNFGWCFTCNKHVDTIQFVIETRNLSFAEAVRYLLD